jgi:pimeloyl-ACP methyl ester carboxylesterase
MFRVESLLSARLFLQPQLAEKRIYFISNLSGKLSLYAMDYGGSIPEPLLPPDIALQNPHLIEGISFQVFNNLGRILVMIDGDGDENYQPMLIPLEGGFPEPAFPDHFKQDRVHLVGVDSEMGMAYFIAASLTSPVYVTYQANLSTGKVLKLMESPYGSGALCNNPGHTRVMVGEHYTDGDRTLYEWTSESRTCRLVYGTPMDQRIPNQKVPLNDICAAHYIRGDQGLLLVTTLFDDRRGLAYLDLSNPQNIKPVPISGILHSGQGELNNLEHLVDNRYLLEFNIDGCSWLYEAVLDEGNLEVALIHNLCGLGQLSNGMAEAISYDKQLDRFAIAFSTSTSPTQIYTIEGPERGNLLRHTRERILGIPTGNLSLGEDASYTSFDGTRISARLYLPSANLGFDGPRPVVLYVHGGPQGQERPDFAWFSMPLIQMLTLNGFAVFVPNVRGSTGYGLQFTRQVDRDWGGKDRQDHIHALSVFLSQDKRLDCSRAGVVGRSYGGYMSLMLAGHDARHWSAAVDMFGPYDLLTFLQRIPEYWKPYFKMCLGDADIPEERAFLIDRSPRTYLSQLTCPLLVIQGKNDPRVVASESRDLVENLRSLGKQVDFLLFENEGHDVLKYENRVTCYNAITGHFIKYLNP